MDKIQRDFPQNNKSKYRKFKKSEIFTFHEIKKKWTFVSVRNSVNDLGSGGWGEKRVVCFRESSSPVSVIFRQRLVLFGSSKEGPPPSATYHSPPDCPWGEDDTTWAKGVPNLLRDEERKGSQHQSQGALCSMGSGSSAGIHSQSVLGTSKFGQNIGSSKPAGQKSLHFQELQHYTLIVF